MKYNVGDKVRIKPKFHFCSVDGFNNINMKDEFFNEYSRLPYCETVMTISTVNKDFYTLKEDRWAYKWTDEMIECKVEEEKSLDEAGLETDFEYEGLAYTLPEGYIFKDENGNVINATKIVLEKKKKEYPTTIEECCYVLNIGNLIERGVKGYKAELFDTFQKLYICRDAYWKIAGEEMGLGKPWEPNWHDDERKYTIEYYDGEIIEDFSLLENRILVFPTSEMRDAFKENFKSEIESCKELL